MGEDVYGRKDARLGLFHLQRWRTVLANLVAPLKPQGVALNGHLDWENCPWAALCIQIWGFAFAACEP